MKKHSPAADDVNAFAARFMQTGLMKQVHHFFPENKCLNAPFSKYRRYETEYLSSSGLLQLTRPKVDLKKLGMRNLITSKIECNVTILFF